MRRATLLLTILLLVLATSCGGGPRQTAVYTDEEGLVRLLPPEVPAGEADSLGYLLDHYWDGMIFSDTLYSHSVDFMLRAMAGYIPALEAGDSLRRAEAVRSLMQRAEVDTLAYVRLMDLSEQLLYDKGLYDEYLPFAYAIVESDFPMEWDKARPEEQIRSIRLNRPGTLASDIPFETLSGDTMRISDLRGKPTILFIYNAPCHTCWGEAEEIDRSPVIGPLVMQGRVTVLALDKWGEKAIWHDIAVQLPPKWIHGANYTDIDTMEHYIVESVPSVYLLDADGRVLLRNASLPELKQQLAQL